MSMSKLYGSIAALAFVLAGSIAQAQNAQGEGGGSGLYPEVTRVAPNISVNRGCTQLEYHAGISKEDCGTLTLTEIVQFMHPAGADDAADQFNAPD